MRFDLQQFIFSARSNPAIAAFWLMVAAALLWFGVAIAKDIMKMDTCPSCGQRFTFKVTSRIKTGGRERERRSWDYQKNRWKTEQVTVTNYIVHRRCSACGHEADFSDSTNRPR